MWEHTVLYRSPKSVLLTQHSILFIVVYMRQNVFIPEYNFVLSLVTNLYIQEQYRFSLILHK